MVAFSNVSDRDLDVYESEDGTGFQPLRLSAYRPPSGVVRDPSIFRHTDGFYYLTYTTIDGANIGFARSSDRMDWKFLGAWPVPFCCAFLPGTGDGTGSASPPGSSGSAGFSDGPSLSPFTTKAWAPEWFVDGDRVNVILSMSTGGGFVPYLMTALEPSLRLWSPPVPLAGIGADHIDTTVVKVGSTYHAFTKNETKKVVEHAVASSVTGPIHSSRLEIGAHWWRAQPGSVAERRLADISRRLYRREVSLFRQHGWAAHLVACARASRPFRDGAPRRRDERAGLTANFREGGNREGQRHR